MAERDDAGRLIELDRAAVIPLGIAAPDLADPSQLLGEIAAPEGRPRLLFLSRLDPKKNLEGLMRAMAMLGDDGPRPFLLVAGGGDRHYAAGLRRLCEELGIAESVAWLGPLAGSRKAAVWAAADLFVLPSHSENFGIAAAEAMLAGLPCVLSHGVALAEQAAGAGAAYLTAPDPHSLARAIRSILADASGRHETGRRAKRYAAQQFDLATMAERLEALYAGAMSAARAGPAQFVAGRLS
jgi:glycosyltransferase involved in cell wall biosynthesis